MRVAIAHSVAPDPATPDRQNSGESCRCELQHRGIRPPTYPARLHLTRGTSTVSANPARPSYSTWLLPECTTSDWAAARSPASWLECSKRNAAWSVATVMAYSYYFLTDNHRNCKLVLRVSLRHTTPTAIGRSPSRSHTLQSLSAPLLYIYSRGRRGSLHHSDSFRPVVHFAISWRASYTEEDFHVYK